MTPEVIEIQGTSYGVEVIPAPAYGPFSRAVRLSKVGTDKVYDVADAPNGATCDCADFIFRRDGKDPHGCKHIKRLRVLRLIRPRPAMRAAAYV
jgi:hypothetical protein